MKTQDVIIFLPSLLNKEVSDKAPSVYLKSFNNSNLKNCFKSHLVNDITEAGLIEDKFDVFDVIVHKVLSNRASCLVFGFTLFILDIISSFFVISSFNFSG